MKRIRKYLTIYLYIFIIFTSTLPNKENITKISEFKTVFPGIDKIYSKDSKKEENQIEYSFKLFEILENIF